MILILKVILRQENQKLKTNKNIKEIKWVTKITKKKTLMDILLM